MKTKIIRTIETIGFYFAKGFFSYQDNLIKMKFDYDKNESLKYINDHLSSCNGFFQLESLWDYSIDLLNKSEENICLEFGVYKGRSINYFSKQLTNKQFFGFDSFVGLKESWKGTSKVKGSFDLKNKLPYTNKNVKLIEGWFDETLPAFLENFNDHIAFVHIDCDTYESSLYILNRLKQYLKKNSYILFDEFFGYPNYKNGEFKALQESKIDYIPLAYSNKQLLIKVI